MKFNHLLTSTIFLGAMTLPSVSQAASPGSIGGPVPLALRAEQHRFALVVGSNDTLDVAQAALRFADDDAASMAELLAEVGYDVELVTSLDQETQALHPELVSTAKTPTPQGLESAWDTLRKRMDAVPDGDDVELLIYYSGHGDVGPDGQGYLTLQGGKLTRNRLFSEILAASSADHNHVLIDACRSEQFVLTRGKTWKNDRVPEDGRAEVGRYLAKNHLGGHPNTGVIVAHSADQQTHEWERYRGGIFTHQLLSGLRGGADLNGDGAIEYSELGAFVAAANSGVKDPRARLSVTVRPPKQDERRPVLSHEDISSQRVLYFPEGPDQKLYTVEDDRGVRLADLRRSGETPSYLRLPSGDIFVSRRSSDGASDGQEATIAAHDGGLSMAPDLEYSRPSKAARGALDQAFRLGLFATPYGPGYYSGYTDQRGLLGVEEPSWRVEVWEVDEDGNETKIAETEVDAEDTEDAAETTVVIETDDEKWWDSGATWGSVFMGTVLTPQNPSGRFGQDTRKVTSGRYRGCLAPHGAAACSVVRGIDLRWQFFSVKRDHKYPRMLGYVRSGYTGGHATFASEDSEPVEGTETEGSYIAVPIFLGGNIYLFDRFPLRPYAGLGFGLDIARLRFNEVVRGQSTTTKAGVGFELHAGLEGRITNHVALNAEVMQQWGSRMRLDSRPDFRNQGFSVVVGVAIGFSLHKSSPPKRTKTVVRSRKVIHPTKKDGGEPVNPMKEDGGEPVNPMKKDGGEPVSPMKDDSGEPVNPMAPSPPAAPQTDVAPPAPPVAPAPPAG